MAKQGNNKVNLNTSSYKFIRAFSDDDFQTKDKFAPSQAPIRSSLTVPLGHVLAAEKWRGTPTVRKLMESISVQYSPGLGVVDFHPSGNCAVFFVNELDIIEGRSYKKKLASSKKVKDVRKVVIAERTPLSLQYFSSLQTFIVLELGFTVIPVPNIDGLASALVQLVNAENKSSKNPYLLKTKVQLTTGSSISSALLTIPKVGDKKVQVLLEKYSSLCDIAKASCEDLSALLGPQIGQIIWDFFHK